MSSHQQWKKFADPDTLICKEGHLLLQKSNGNPSCVLSSTYLKSIQRGYYDTSIMSKRPEMMNSETGQGMYYLACSWCPDYQMSVSRGNFMGYGSDRIMDMMHNMWINSGMIHDMNTIMLQNPSHMTTYV